MLLVSIILEQAKCPNCSGSLSKATGSWITCPYCESEFYSPPKKGYRIPGERPYPHPAGVAIVKVGSAAYRVHGRLDRGQHGDVFLARRERALTELVVLKVAHHAAGEEGLRREWLALHQIRARNEFLRHMTAEPIAFESCADGRSVGIYRWRPGFSFTFLDAKQQYPQGVDPRAAVWMWNRILDQLKCLEAIGWSHQAIGPEHLLLHPRDHGVALCGWSEAVRAEGNDLGRSGTAIASLLGANAPKALREMARHAAAFDDATAAKEELRRISEAAFGPPRFHTFTLTGGNNHGIW